MSSGYWGAFTYGAGDRVPLRATRCTTTLTTTSAPARTHGCRQHKDHVGPHRCICGESWPRIEVTP